MYKHKLWKGAVSVIPYNNTYIECWATPYNNKCNIHVCMYMYICTIYIYIYTHIYIYICIHIYVYIYCYIIHVRSYHTITHHIMSGGEGRDARRAPEGAAIVIISTIISSSSSSNSSSSSSLCICIYIYIYICIQLCVYVYMCVCVCMCICSIIYVYIYIYIYTYIYIYMNAPEGAVGDVRRLARGDPARPASRSLITNK